MAWTTKEYVEGHGACVEGGDTIADVKSMKGLATGVSCAIREEGLSDVSLEVFTEKQMIGMNSMNNEEAMHDNERGAVRQKGSHKRSPQAESEKGSEAFVEIPACRKAKRAKRSTGVICRKNDATKNESMVQQAMRAVRHETGDKDGEAGRRKCRAAGAFGSEKGRKR